MLTREQKIEDIKRACIVANEDIVALKFGCNFKVVGNLGFNFIGNGIVVSNIIALIDVADSSYRGVGHKEIKTKLLHFKPNLFEIIGRDIRLADILLMIGQDLSIVGAKDGQACFLQWGQPPMGVNGQRGYWNYQDIKWNLLKDSLVDQEGATIDFIHSLLPKHEN